MKSEKVADEEWLSQIRDQEWTGILLAFLHDDGF